MSSRLVLSVLVCVIAPGIAGAQDAQPESGPPAVVELLEDNTAFLIEHLHNHGLADASVAERNEQTFFSGACSLAVTDFQRFNAQIPGWKHEIAENPKPGQFRYLRFAWKRTEAPGIMLQLHARPNVWHRYYAGTVSQRTEAFGAMTRVTESAPRKWDAVTRDLFEDFGPMTITGIGLSALEGPGHAYYDHIYLGRTIHDLDRVTAAKKRVTEGDEAPSAAAPEVDNWLLKVLALAGIVAALLFCLVSWVRSSRRKRAAAAAAAAPTPAGAGSAAVTPSDGLIALSCSACGKRLKVKEVLAGKRVKCSGCGQGLTVPQAPTG